MTHFVEITQITKQGRQSPYGQQWSASMGDDHRGHYETKNGQRSPEAALRNLAEMVRGESIWGTFVSNECESYTTEPRTGVESHLYEIQRESLAVAARHQQQEERLTVIIFEAIAIITAICALVL